MLKGKAFFRTFHLGYFYLQSLSIHIVFVDALDRLFGLISPLRKSDQEEIISADSAPLR